MQTNRLTRIIAIGIVAMLAFFVVSRMRPTAEVSNRIHAAYNEAEQPVLKPGSGLVEADKFAADLRRIDLDGATQDVKDAMAALIDCSSGNQRRRAAKWRRYEHGEQSGRRPQARFAQDAGSVEGATVLETFQKLIDLIL